jgi:hypothetical protein
MKTPTLFEIGNCYSRDNIHEKLGGSKISYAPTVNNRVVCLCLNKACNPKAPQIVMTGSGAGIERAKDLIIEQGGPFPVFVKVRTKSWKFTGEFEVTSWTQDRREIADIYEECETPLEKVTALIWFTERN